RHTVGPGVYVPRRRLLRGGDRGTSGHGRGTGRARPEGGGRRDPRPAQHLGPAHPLRLPADRGRPRVRRRPGTCRRAIRDRAPRHRREPKATWYFATPLRVSRLEVSDADARPDAAAGTQIGLMTAGGPTRWFAASAPSASRLAISLPHPVTGVAVVAQAGGRPSHLGPLSITDT